MLCGSIILGISIWLRVSKEMMKIAGRNVSEFHPALDILIAVGTIIMVLGFLGCCGAMKESKCLLILFFIGLLLILALQITAGILGAVYKSQVESLLNDTYKELIPLNNQSDDTVNKIRLLQKEYNCCGLLNGYSDWGKDHIPPSCNCVPSQAECAMTDSGKSVWAQSCVDAFIDLMKANFVIVVGIAFGLAMLEIFGLVFSMTLYCQIESK
uniref:tetraspanin-8-like isoform X2 n=1 Tax=Pristiophorus japonicus TaxID=55135 RepID=UPI00398EA55B